MHVVEKNEEERDAVDAFESIYGVKRYPTLCSAKWLLFCNFMVMFCFYGVNYLYPFYFFMNYAYFAFIVNLWFVDLTG